MSRISDLYEKLHGKQNGVGEVAAPSSASADTAAGGKSRVAQLYEAKQQREQASLGKEYADMARAYRIAWEMAGQEQRVLGSTTQEAKDFSRVQRETSYLNSLPEDQKGYGKLYLKYYREYANMTPEQQANEAKRLSGLRFAYGKEEVSDNMKKIVGRDGAGYDVNNDKTVNARDLASQLKNGAGISPTNDSNERYQWLMYFGNKDALGDRMSQFAHDLYLDNEKAEYEAAKKRRDEIEASGALTRPEEQKDALAYRSGAENFIYRLFGMGPYDEDDPEVAAYNEAQKEYDALTQKIDQYERLVAVQDKTRGYTRRSDFEEKSGAGTPGTEDYIQNPSEASDEATANRIGSLSPGSPGGVPVGSIADIVHTGADVWGGMNEDEKKTWYYIYRTEGAEKAREYLNEMTDLSNYRTKEEIQKDIENAGFWEQYIASLASIPLGLADKISGAASDALGAVTGEYHPYSPAHGISSDIRAGVSSGMSDTEKFFYEGGLSAADSALGAALMGNAYTVVMGMGAASERAKELWEQGATEGQIVLGAGLDGVAEALFEKLSIEHLLSSKSVTGVWSWLKERVLKQAFIEGSEELATGVANVVNDIVVRGEQSDTYKKYMTYYESNGGNETEALKSTLSDVLGDLEKQAAAGAFSGALLGGAYSNYDSVAAAENRIRNTSDAITFIKTMESERAAALADGRLSAEADAYIAEAEERVRNKYNLGAYDVNATEAGDVVGSEAFKREVVGRVSRARAQARSQEYLTTDSGATEYVDEKGKVTEGAVVARVVEENGEKKYELGSGEVVSTDRVTFGTSAQATVYGALNSSAMDAESETQVAKAILDELGEDASPVKAMEAVVDAENAYNYGRLGLGYAEALQTSNTGSASTGLMNTAYDLGRAQYNASAAAEQGAVDRGELSYKRKGAGQVVYEDSVTEDDMKHLAEGGENSIGMTDVNALSSLADALGMNIHLYASRVGADGKRSATVRGKKTSANGFYEHATGDIYIDVYSGRTGNSLIMYTAAHELTHFIRQNSPAQYKALADFLVETYGAKGQSVDDLIDRQIEKADADGRTIDRDEALEEVVADSMESMLADGKVIEQLAKEKPNVVQRLIARIKEWISALKARYAKLDPDSAEGKMVKGWTDEFTKLQEMYTEALRSAREGYAKAGVGEATSTEVSVSEQAREVEKRDSEYLAAVERGDMETAQRMVDEAAERAMPESKVRDEDGKLLLGYHGTDAEFTSFDRTKGRSNMDIQGMFFSPWELDAQGYGSKVGAYYLNITNPAPEGVAYKALNKFAGQNNAGVKAREYLESLGYDGVNNGGEEYIAFYPEQIKLADPVTYDDEGNVIPLSERFNEASDDIRYSSREQTQAERDSAQTAKDLRRRFGLRMSDGDIAVQLGELYEQIEREMTKETPDMDALDAAVQKVVSAIDEVRTGKGQRDMFAQAALDEIRGTKIFLDEKQVAEIKHAYGSLREFTQKFFGDRVTFTSDKSAGVSLDSVWQEWATQFPAYFDAETSSNDMPSALLDALDSMKNTTDESAAVDYKSLDAELESAIWEGYNAFTAKRTSNRAILSNALESAAQTPEETRNIQRYKETIAEIEEAEARVKEINAEIKELSFAKGPRDTARLAELQKEKTALERKITKADGRLLLLEASKPLKDLVRRTRENTRKAVSAEYIAREAQLRAERDAEIERVRLEERWKGAEKNHELRRQRDEAIEAVEDKYRRRLADMRSNRNAAEIRRKIENSAKRLRQRLLRPAENKYVPKGMLRPVAELLYEVARYNGKGVKAADAAIEMQKRYLEEATRVLSDGQEIADNPVTQLVEQVKGIFEGDRSLRDLTVDELDKVYRAARAIEHLVSVTTKTVSLAKAIDLGDLRVRAVTEVGSGKGLSWYRLETLRPKTVFEALGNFTKDGALETTYDILNGGAMRAADINMWLNEIFAHLMPGKGGGVKVDYKTFDNFIDPDNAVDIGLVDEDGNKYTVTHDMLVMLALSLDHPDNRAYIEENGLIAPNKSRYYKGDVSRAYSKGSTRILSPYANENEDLRQERRDLNAELKDNISDERRQEINDRIGEIEDKLTANTKAQHEWADELRKKIGKAMTEYDRDWYDTWRAFAEASQGYLNEATQKMYGFDRATVENYFPIRTDSRFGTQAFESVSYDYSVENANFMKAREGKGLRPLYLEGVSYVAQDHVRKVSQYAGLAPALRDFGMIYGKQAYIKGRKPRSLMYKIGQVYDKKAEEWIENLIADLNGGRKHKTSPIGKTVAKLRSHYAGAVLALNPSVAFGQTASAPTAAAVLGAKPVLKAFTHHGLPGTGQATPELIAKYTSIFYNRNVGVLERGASTAVGRQNVIERTEQKLGFILNWISGMDSYTVNRLWWAAEYYVQDHSPKLYEKGAESQSEEYYKEVARMFVRVIQETQPNYTTMQRPEILRDPNELVRSLTMFMTQRLQNSSILYESRRKWLRYRYDYKHGRNNVTEEDVKEARREFERSTLSVVSASATLVAFKFGAAALLYRLNPWRDEDKELTPESMCEHLLDMLLDSVLSNYLGGSEAYTLYKKLRGKNQYNDDLFQVNSIERVNKIVDDFVTAVKAITDATKANASEEDKEKAWIKLKGAAATMIETVLGLPVNNAGKIVDAFINWGRDIADGEGIDFEQRVERTSTVNARRLVKAYVAGDGEKVTTVETEFDDKKDAISKVKEYLGDQYGKGKIDRETVTKVLSGYCDMSDDEIYWWFDKKDSGLGQDYKKYEEFVEAVNTGKGLEAAAKKYLDNGVKKQQLADAITDKYKEEYVGYEKSGNKKAMESLKKKLLDGYEAAGYDRDDKEDDIDKWYYQQITEDYKAGEMSRAEAEKALKSRYDLTDDDLYWWFKERDAAIAEEDYGKYDDFYTAVQTGKDLKKVIKTYTDNGVETKTLASQITKYFKPIYLSANTAGKAKLKGYLLNAYELLGYDRVKKSADIGKWKEE